MRLIRAADLERACPMPDAIEAVAAGFVALSDGRAHVPVRISAPIEQGGLAVAMPASLDGSRYFTVKVVGVAPGARAKGLPFINATVLLGDAETGAPLAILEGTALTTLRTGAAGGVAARALAAPDASVLALFGAGAQARTQLAAALAVRPIAEVRVVTRDPRHAADFVTWARGVCLRTCASTPLPPAPRWRARTSWSPRRPVPPRCSPATVSGRAST